MKTQLSSTELQLQFEAADFVVATQRQIAKDFSLSGVDFSADFLDRAETYEQLLTDVEDKLAALMQLGESKTLQLLYQIDIPQEDFLELTSDPDFMGKMSDLIIKREAYKVYLRRKF